MSIDLRCGDALGLLKEMPEASVQVCVTSPPYWALRNYGVDGQLGLERTPEEYVEHLVEVFREVRRVLRDDGTLWLNLGDSYAAARGGTDMPAETLAGGVSGHGEGDTLRGRGHSYRANRDPAAHGLKHKDLVGIPWRVAFALQADGWWLRSDIIWAKPNPMPESVTDRPTKSHEYLFLLTKSARYYYNAEAIAEPCETDAKENYPARAQVIGRGGLACLEQSASPQQRTSGGLPPRWPGIGPQHATERDRGEKYEPMQTHPTRNARSVWTIATSPYPDAHFATFPPELPRRCILAGSRGPGKRCDCEDLIATPLASGPVDDPTDTTGRAGMNRVRREGEGSRDITRREQRGYAQQMKDSPHRRRMEAEAGKAFAHYIRTDLSGGRPLPPDLLDQWLERGWLVEPPPCWCPVMPGDTVLDPFAGAGTTGLVADRLGRSFIGCELNPAYVTLARRRIMDDAPLFNGVAE